MTGKEILCAYSVDFDAVSGWLGSYGGERSPCDISRGFFAGEIGVPRLLQLFRRKNILTTWFVPGHSIESFPEQSAQIVSEGHEIGLHGYTHENPSAMSRQQQADVLDKCIDLITRLSGRVPVGHNAPWWEFSEHTHELLLERGIRYDHSLMHRDFEPYFLRQGDQWTAIDYECPASHWMSPVTRGEVSDLVEIPASWDLDDMEPLLYIKGFANSQGYVGARNVEQQWRDQFDFMYREYDFAVFPMTIHPDVSGKAQALLMHERLIDYFLSFPGVRFVTFAEIDGIFRERQAALRDDT
ncbi:polysaccharide deacetylase [Hydrogenophaga sp. Root209]|uniref:polysaccharide deacetylase family protein n=1 Tax=Hydrogenophaga sp. Root209 TaxID=1736490 RepID=UPI0006FC107B|nr:polysaccharide deacetylase [Hydrogenophaga sp. Root209]KRC12123.1 polysaccharide deacetylase [Hydrogenophaga sp. Root209]